MFIKNAGFSFLVRISKNNFVNFLCKPVILNENFITEMSNVPYISRITLEFQLKTINIPVNNLNLRENSGFHEGQRKKKESRRFADNLKQRFIFSNKIKPLTIND